MNFYYSCLNFANKHIFTQQKYHPKYLHCYLKHSTLFLQLLFDHLNVNYTFRIKLYSYQLIQHSIQRYSIKKPNTMSFIINRMSNMSIIPPYLIQKRSSELSLNIGNTNSREELFNLKTIEIRNAKEESFHQKKIILIESLITLVNIFVISITILNNFDLRSNNQFDQNQKEINYDQQIEYRFLMIFSICLVILNFIRTVCRLQFQNQANELSQSKEPKPFGEVWMGILAESVFCFVHPSSLTSDMRLQFCQPPLQVNKILSCVVYVRFITILLFLLKITRFYGLRVNRVLGLYAGDQNDFGILYTIKCFLKQNGLKSPFIIYGIIITVFPFFIICISPRFSLQEHQVSSASMFLQAIYDIIISMATIGYGDLLHDYSSERIIFIVIIVLGSLSSSFFTLTFLNWFKLSEQEEKALRSIKRLSLKQDIQRINSKKVTQFVKALVELKRKKQENPQINPRKSTESLNNKILPMLGTEMQHNQNLTSSKQTIHLKSLLSKLPTPQKKFINQRLNDTRDTFKDFYERSQLELSQLIKLLIERTLLTNNLMQFYLMRQHNNKSQHILQNSLSSDSAQTIKSRKRVDDNIKMYELRQKIIQSTLSEGKQVKNQKEEQV